LPGVIVDIVPDGAIAQRSGEALCCCGFTTLWLVENILKILRAVAIEIQKKTQLFAAITTRSVDL
jgi:hypothetical protein